MKKLQLLAATAMALVTTPLAAQTAATSSAGNTAPTNGPGQEATTAESTPEQTFGADIVVTAQRQSQRLQDVPIAVSAFTAENLERQQIVNPLALQQTLPNVTFTKTNFTSSSFTIRGIGDLCVGVTCDSATAIHVNDMPLLSTRLFESEFFDLERVEVLRGPQGTLFGRNATSGVVNFITAKPDLSGIHAAGEFEYGNYDSKRVRGMFNLPLGDTLGVRVAGQYLKRDGLTYNVFDNTRIDGRDLYSVRGTLSWEPTADTRVDLIAYYFREDDDRSRIQKQLCNRDPTGVLGCAPDRLENETVNADASLGTAFASREFLTLRAGALAPLGLNFASFALGSIYNNDGDAFSGFVNPVGNRRVNIDFKPTYFAEEEQYTAKVFHDFGPVSLNVTGGYMTNTVVSRSDYQLNVADALTTNAGLNTFNAVATSGSPLAAPLLAVRNVLIPNGPAGGFCQSGIDRNNVGVYGGVSAGCFPRSLDFDESSQKVSQYSVEAHLDSQFDGAFNFLIGGIYFNSKTRNNSYYVNSFGLDYAAGLLGAATTIQQRLPVAFGGAGNAAFPSVFIASPFFRNNTDRFELKSYGIFGETYFEVNDRLKLTLGARYNNDDKTVRARTTLFQDAVGGFPLVPIGATSITQALNYAALDYDAATPGVQEFAEGRVKFQRLTGRAVIDYRITPDNLLYASYSRGYKSGGINPPLSPTFAVDTFFAPEKVDSFEIGSKNTFGNGRLRLNVTGFYYKYQGLQLSRIVSRTAVNDNVNADIYGLEGEAVISPIRALVVNLNASYLKSKVSGDKLLSNPQDPSGYRSDAVIIKDVTSTANCGLVNNAGSAALANAFVATVNGIIGTGVGNPALLRPPTPVPGTTTTGAFSICSALSGAAAGGLAALGTTAAARAQLAALQQATFGVAGPLPFTVFGTGVPVNIRGNQLPQAPMYKFAAGIQYTVDFANGMSLVPRADLNYTGNFYGSIFNQPIDRIQGYEIVNAQVQLNGPGERWYVRGFVRNLTKNDAITGQGVGDQSSGLFTNIFTLEPRQYGIAAGFKF
jgi:outer membrane receptor protein involved in Fe transport